MERRNTLQNGHSCGECLDILGWQKILYKYCIRILHLNVVCCDCVNMQYCTIVRKKLIPGIDRANTDPKVSPNVTPGEVMKSDREVTKVKVFLEVTKAVH